MSNVAEDLAEEKIIDEIIQAVRKYNKISIQKEDPLFSIVTANALVLEKYIETVDRMLNKHYTDLEDTTQNYLGTFRDKTETEFNAALEQSMNIINKEVAKQKDALNLKLNVIKNFSVDSPKKDMFSFNKMYFLVGGCFVFAAGYLVALMVM